MITEVARKLASKLFNLQVHQHLTTDLKEMLRKYNDQKQAVEALNNGCGEEKYS